jgi:2-polyprenyl-6-methoxyphenol hydroxylase-like FAD-dependent oxidoreductase
VELTAALAASPVPDALAAYDQRRRPRAQKVARASARTGQLIRLRNPFAVAVRDTVIRLLPPSVSGPQSGRLLDWTPPRVDGPADRTVQ